MTFWTLLGAMLVIAATGAALPLVRRYAAPLSEADAALAVLKDQLADIDAQVEAGALASAEAEPLRLEVRRRLLAEARIRTPDPRPLSSSGHGKLAIGLALMLALGAGGLYAAIGRPDLARPLAPPPSEADRALAEVERLIPKIEARLAESPNEAEGWRLLGWAYYQTGRFKEAVNAYRRAVALAPEAPGQQSAYGEALVQAAGGLVTPDAEKAFEAARQIDAGDARARYFLGLLKAQRGDPRAALDDWTRLLQEAPADAPWAGELRGAVAQLAQQAGIDMAGRLPSSGPSADQMQAAAAMSPEDRQAMIRGMVDNLAARLAENPRDVDGWVRLMRARMVLGEPAAASGALSDALAAFRDAPARQQELRAAARSLQIPEPRPASD